MRIACLGAGTMGSALLHALIKKQRPSWKIRAWDVCPERRDSLPKSITITEPSLWFAGRDCPDTVLLCVKPSDMSSAIASLCNGEESPGKACLWISIAAGISLSSLHACIGRDARICRVMPNMPARIGEGMSVFAASHCLESDIAMVHEIFGACGEVLQLEEYAIPLATGLSGSGPAYVYYFIESLIEAGITTGLAAPVARKLALQTVRGAVLMCERTDEHTGVLKQSIMSPGGTTANGLLALEREGFKYAVIKAVTEAAERAKALDQPLCKGSKER